MKDEIITDYKLGDNTDEEKLNKSQSETNAERTKLMEAVSPEIQLALTKIHEAASILNAAKIPFLLLATPPGCGGFMQYNRLSYIEPRFSKEEIADSRNNIVAFHRYASAIYTGMFSDNRVCYVASDSTVFEYIERGKVYNGLPGLRPVNKDNLDKNPEVPQSTATNE